MRFVCIVMLLASQHLLAAERPPALPKDVSAFLERRESCDHWRGEEGYDAERQADIDWSICQSCTGSDAKLASLKKKYWSNSEVMARLKDFEVKIEPDDKAAAKVLCSATRKPAW